MPAARPPLALAPDRSAAARRPAASPSPYLTPAGALLALGAAVVLCWPMLPMGGPLVYFDTVSYFTNGEELWWRAIGMVLGAIHYGLGIPVLDPAGSGAGAAAAAQAGAQEGTQTIRSLAYAAFFYPAASTPLSLALVCIGQTAMTLWVFLGLVPPLEGAARRQAVIGFAAVAGLTTLPWFASYAMPDLLGAVLPVYFALALGRADGFGRWTRLALGAIACFAILAHYGHLPLSLALAAAALAWRAWHRRLTGKALAFILVPVATAFAFNFAASLAVAAVAPAPTQLAAVERVAPVDDRAKGFLGGSSPFAGGATFQLAALTSATAAAAAPAPAPALPPRPAAAEAGNNPGGASFAPNRVPVLLARSLEDGPARWYLQDECRDRDRYAICELFDTMPDSVYVLLWSDEGLHRATPEQLARIRAQESEIVFAAARRYPLQQAAALVKNTAHQFVLVGTGELLPWPAGERGAHLGALEPRTADNEASAVLTVFDWITPVVTFLALALLAWRLATGRTVPELREVAAMVLFALLINAAVYGGLSAPVDRYQSRLAWLIPALLALDLAWQAGALRRPRRSLT